MVALHHQIIVVLLGTERWIGDGNASMSPAKNNGVLQPRTLSRFHSTYFGDCLLSHGSYWLAKRTRSEMAG
jgi:hypothetical protein